MQIKSKILTTLRVINIIVDNLEAREYIDASAVFSAFNMDLPDGWTDDPREEFKDYDRAMPRNYLIKLLERAGISSEDYGVIANILKSMALMTNGNIKTIRNPSGFKDEFAEPWSSYFKQSDHFLTLVDHIGINLRQRTVEEDYALANKMLKLLGSSILDEKEVVEMFDKLGIEKRFGMTQKVAKQKYLQIPEILYRGLKDLSLRSYKKVTTVGYIWDIGKAVSTSAVLHTSENFASKSKNGYGIVFVINNPNRQGFVADRLSTFHEEEVILSGKLKVTGFEPGDIKKSYTTIYVDLI
jgi:hypothetical protein